MSNTKELLLKARIEGDREAKQQLLEQHQAMMRSIINKATVNFHYGLNMEDVRSAANHGFLEAVKSFDLRRIDRVSLATHAYNLVRKYVYEEIYQQTNLVHVPQNLLSSRRHRLSDFAQALADYEATQPPVTFRTFAMNQLGLEENEFWNVEAAFKARYQLQSWDAPVSDSEDEVALGDSISVEQVKGGITCYEFMDPAKYVLVKEFLKGLKQVFDCMTLPARALFRSRLLAGIPKNYFSIKTRSKLPQTKQKLLKPLQDYVKTWGNV